MAEGRQRVLIRVTPGPRHSRSRAVTTGISDQKFDSPSTAAMPPTPVEASALTPGLRLIGLHCHLGSQVTDAAIYGEAIRG